MVKHTISLFTENKNEAIQKRTPSLQSNMEVQWWFGVALLTHVHVIMEIPRHFWAQCRTLCQESWVSVEGRSWFFQQDKTPNTLKTALRNDSRQTLDCSEVASNESRSKSHWKLVEGSENRRKHPSNLGKLEQFAQEEWAKLPVQRCRKLINGCRKHLIAVIFTKGCATRY